MSIREITQKEDWHPVGTEFFQSWEWGEFQAVAGYRPIRLCVDGTYIQGFVHSLPLGLVYVYWPRIWNIDYRIMEHAIRMHVKNALFSRVEPSSVAEFQIPNSTFHIPNRQPQHTLILDLTKTEEQLLSDMHSKTRYNIRLAEKKGVEVREGKHIDWFWDLNKETRERDGFKSHEKSYYQALLQLPIVHQLTAFFDNTPIASQIYIGNKGVCTYLHGASGNAHRNLMAPYLLQWESIRIAKKFGNTQYDFFGVARPQTDGETFHTYSWNKADKLSGVTRYKAGFGGEVRSYPDAYEVPLRPVLYSCFRFLKKLV
jgi:lipid II:glycine glycyltransferase (peptidoglycan interpeptide bridge formation enzyme)